ncbi:hypothetical protein U0070_004712 [Myodes glareolus]|uniref:RING-type E3 ubiquitin transferase n=1 Tax=Myodes glareolus TaxID=447135 RepID=A0AAW0IAD8_MYOGA
MSEELSAATSYTEDDFYCPVCQEVLKTPVRTAACQHVYIFTNNLQIKFYRMRHHYKSCKKYQDEYGVSSVIPNFKISQDPVRSSNRNETPSSDNTETYQENTSSSGHPTFKCPLCQESNFTRQRLLDHCNSNHLFQIVPVVSTYIQKNLLFKACGSMNLSSHPSQITRNFVSHLNQRHQFDYGEFVNLQLDEEAQYQTAVEESFQVNI